LEKDRFLSFEGVFLFRIAYNVGLIGYQSTRLGERYNFAVESKALRTTFWGEKLEKPLTRPTVGPPLCNGGIIATLGQTKVILG